jgi:hypothetical protein
LGHHFASVGIRQQAEEKVQGLVTVASDGLPPQSHQQSTDHRWSEGIATQSTKVCAHPGAHLLEQESAADAVVPEVDAAIHGEEVEPATNLRNASTNTT